MQQITFAPGKTVLVTGKEYLVTGISDDNVVHLLSRDNIDKKVDLETLHDWYLTGNLRAANQDKSLSKRKNKEETKKVQRNEFHSEEAKERGLVVKAFVDAVNQSDVRLDDKDPTFRQVVDELAEKHGIAPPICSNDISMEKPIPFHDWHGWLHSTLESSRRTRRMST